MWVTYSKIKRSAARCTAEATEEKTFPSQTAGKFTAEEKKEETEDNAEIQCIITRANQLLFVCAAKLHMIKEWSVSFKHNKLALIDHLKSDNILTKDFLGFSCLLSFILWVHNCITNSNVTRPLSLQRLICYMTIR